MTTKYSINNSENKMNGKINPSLLLMTSTTSNSTFQNTTTKLNNLTINTTNLLEDEEKDKIIIAEFAHLLDKSKQLFNGLRDLPQFGHSSNQWQAYFGRTFDVYTKLWKYQQQHRQILDQKYNLKRWQIGEIASKIGQLYYHYYLRTSESNYLNESFSFYQAIQTRSYYSKANKEEKPDLMVKKLRYYARFIVVCLLLKKTKQVKELIKELTKQIEEYVRVFDPEDQLEWQMVRNEINDFIESDALLNIESTNNTNQNTLITNRLTVSQVPTVINDKINSNLLLQEILIIGNRSDQIKFSELSLDMFRMLQSVEREPSPINENNKLTNFLINDVDKHKENSESIIQRENPHKYLLYKPSFSQFLTYISAAFKDLAHHAVMMVYISADSCESQLKIATNYEAYDNGGVKTNNKKEISNILSTSNVNANNLLNNSNTDINRKNNFKEAHCIYPGDLYAFLRKPFFLIVDSNNSSVFKFEQGNIFGQPFIALLSPVNSPQGNQNQKGSIFTLFLTNPIVAFCFVCNKNNLSVDLWIKCQVQLRLIFTEISKLFSRSKYLDSIFLQFCNDDFLRAFLYRFVFCFVSLKLHRNFRGSDFYPSSQPALSIDIVENSQLHELILELSNILDLKNLFLNEKEEEI